MSGLIILSWVACGVLAYGGALAFLQTTMPMPAADTRHERAALAAYCMLGGPFFLIAAFIVFGQFRHGLMFRVRP